MPVKYLKPHGGSFTTLVANLKQGSDPSRGTAGNPQHQRSTVTMGAIHHVEGGGLNARVAGAIAPQTASITVADNDFSTGRAILYLGPYILIHSIDYQVGGNANATATNLAACINLTPEFAATSNLAVVSVTCDQPLLLVQFSAVHYGTHTNFTLSPSTGHMAAGGPTVSAPSIT